METRRMNVVKKNERNQGGLGISMRKRRKKLIEWKDNTEGKERVE